MPPLKKAETEEAPKHEAKEPDYCQEHFPDGFQEDQTVLFCEHGVYEREA